MQEPIETDESAEMNLPVAPLAPLTPVANTGNNDFDSLYEFLNNEYYNIQAKYNIEEKSKIYAKKLSRSGCSIIILLSIFVAAFFLTDIRWYWVLGEILLVLIISGSSVPKWDLEYANIFLKRIQKEREKNPFFFDSTFRTWVDNLPEKDQAKAHFNSIIKNINTEGFKIPEGSETGKDYRKISEEDLEFSKNLNLPIPIPENPAREVDPVSMKLPPDSQDLVEHTSARVENKEKELCPRCGSNWIRYIEKVPGKYICVCESCSKKWRSTNNE